jgi:hypothetical protein
MPASIKNSEALICPDCEALILKDYCPRCGYTIQKDPIELEDVETPIVHKSALFESKSDKKDDKKKKISLFGRIIPIFLLLFILGGISGYGYWLYQGTSINLLSPIPELVISNSEEGLIADVKDSSEESIIDFDIKLKEGNLIQYNFAQFALPEVSIYLQMFGTYDYLKKFYAEDVTAKYLKGLDLKEDDLNVYLSSGFAITLPEDNFDRWGYVTTVVDKKYVEGKIALLENLRDKKRDKQYQDLFASLVTIKSTNPEGKEEEAVFLLASNSKEYLDQMKEVSEGVLPNLGNSALFAQAQKALPAIGNALIYRNKKVEFSTQFYGWFASKFDYEGLDKILGKIESSTLVLYSQAGKLKIAGISDL